MTPTQRAHCYQTASSELAHRLLQIAGAADWRTSDRIQEELKKFAISTCPAYKKIKEAP